MSLEDIVNVVVTINQSTIAQQGFGTPLIYAATPFADLTRTYAASSWNTAMVTDGFSPLSAAYRTAYKMMQQSPRPTTFKVGKRTTAETQIVRLVPTAQNTAVYSLKIDNADQSLTETATFTSDSSATVAEVCTGLAAAINALTAAVTADGSSGTWVVVTADAADRVFSYYDLTANLLLEDWTAATGIDTDLTNIKAYDDDWYAVALASSSPAAIEMVADWVEGKFKIFVPSTHDGRPLTNSTTDIVSSIDAQNYPRTHVPYNSHAGDFYGPAWMAALLPYEPGAADWKFKTLKGVRADKLTTTQATYLLGKGGSYYETVYVGLDITGAAVGGDRSFLDLTQLSDWLRARTIESALRMFTSAPKVAHTDQDAGNKIWGSLKQVLDQAVANNAVDGDPATWTITVPKRASLSSGDKTARRWPGNVMNLTPTGAVHSLGTLNIYLNVA